MASMELSLAESLDVVLVGVTKQLLEELGEEHVGV
jgi:hypothetical protein